MNFLIFMLGIVLISYSGIPSLEKNSALFASIGAGLSTGVMVYMIFDESNYLIGIFLVFAVVLLTALAKKEKYSMYSIRFLILELIIIIAGFLINLYCDFQV
ncbi:hypothetical protein ACEN4P_09095 [Marinilactibacillus psychrotolerans]|uniref:Uncharacterized protein n=1 Tax=Marinilactibacillus psychrotolerans TaxID=191770 RepID=A0ABW8UJF7_9LACT|nr:hypothetical protein [Marinilactibacillus psychrotolerans]GEQ33706.1 hypothetical protein B795N_15880 [Marinilactibacillus psychrotolerans]